ncbi:unnamed protein product [Pseudo-nitzschia multistriata]|uniref:Sulfotransferase domain-containing protein n=1 Tax=Pseudo-nitzschia multistriata TaxID=183589 RepID=A0A448ZPI1_9STRA|nr:unnamed protein product [Pseudo-nitzschia multistriata]
MIGGADHPPHCVKQEGRTRKHKPPRVWVGIVLSVLLVANRWWWKELPSAGKLVGHHHYHHPIQSAIAILEDPKDHSGSNQSTTTLDSLESKPSTLSLRDRTSRNDTEPTGNPLLNEMLSGSQPTSGFFPSSNNRHKNLRLQFETGTRVTLLHIGKTGGSALRQLVRSASEYCRSHNHNGTVRDNPSSQSTAIENHGEGTAAEILHHHMCALARVTDSRASDDGEGGDGTQYQTNGKGEPPGRGLVHLDRNLHKTLTNSHFLVPIRNPIDRLVSWFHYERHFQAVLGKRRSHALHDLVDPHRCNYRTVEELVLGHGGAPGAGTNSSNSHNNSSNSIHKDIRKRGNRFFDDFFPSGIASEYCSRLARQCLEGSIPCYAHNFFNYEYYLEDVLVRILMGRSRAANTTANATSNATTDSNMDQAPVPRIDVIRAEDSAGDLNRTLLEWTGLPVTPEMDSFYTVRKPFGVDTHYSSNEITTTTTSDNDDNDDQSHSSNDIVAQQKPPPLSDAAASTLCGWICPELLAYAKIVSHASNLSQGDKQRTLDRLDESCGGGRGEVRKLCGGTFYYRRVRSQRRPRFCEPGTGTTRGPTGGENRRQRRLSYLRSGQGYPPC